MNKGIYRLGYRSGLVAFMATIAFSIVQMLQLLGVLHYPFDEIWIYGFSLCITIPFMIEMLCLHHITKVEKNIWSHAALLFTVIYVVFVISNYVVQLATVIPATVKGTLEDIHILRQTPHSLFWDFDAMGYIFMGFATLFAAPLFAKDGLERWVRFSFLTNAFVTPLIAFVYFYPNFSDKLLLLAIPWSITAPAAMLMLSLLFKNKLKEAINSALTNQRFE